MRLPWMRTAVEYVLKLKIVSEFIEGNWTEGLVLVVVVKEKHITQSKVGVHVVTRTYIVSAIFK